MYNNRTFSLSLQKTLNLPIRVALFDRKLSVKDLSLLMNKTAYKYSYTGLHAFCYGVNTASINFNYVYNLYKALSLPIPTPQYLYESFQRWEEIKAFKKNRRNTNRIKRGQEPIP